MEKKIYLGDGVYASVDDQARVVLQTENGISVLDRIYMEPEVVDAFLRYLRSIADGRV